MKNKTIFVACDTSNLKKIKKIISQTRTNKLKIIPKFGLQFFYSKQGRKFLENIKNDFWLDLKINDIPQTALSAIDSLKDLKKCRYITVHVNGGLEMLKSIKKKVKKINKNLKVLGVTILTSLNNKSLKEIGHTKNVKQLVLKQAALIKKSGCDGIVCSAQEALMVRKKYKNLLIITPGIRLPGDSSNDQMRIMTPKQAFKNKVSGIVIGRSLTKGNIKNNTKKLADHLNK
ncbi:orotidine-5'-phosphate decarboxylase [Candidatus Pelagibacter sp. FZCC0015]|uniref:orotidine-5'-phosphate decarboxylase n=1 Tax=Candidatus Pelagibacter sp. FZCC0015 TaxID=2268451 RepID=UPI0011A839DD|nr:orotidine-5'-phosphate decarboxylase [Candidatus Pelagibacter sp. FZCC0015]